MENDLLRPLISQQGKVVIALSKIFLNCKPAEKIERYQDYAKRFKVGVGTVQAALKYLQDVGAINLSTKGHLGTFIEDINYPQLCALAGQDIIVGGMPLPYSRRYEGLATGLNKAFTSANLGINLLFSRGSMNRIKNLIQNRYDFIVLSKYACDSAITFGWKIKSILELGIETYVGQHAILLRDPSKNTIENGMKVGIDPDSIDQVNLCKEITKNLTVEFVEISYMNLSTALQENQIDATIWNTDDFAANGQSFKIISIEKNQITQNLDNTVAVIAVKDDHQSLIHTFQSSIDVNLILEIQRKVMKREMLPMY
ncbi:MAG: hypothetical protein GYA52_12720 [Chloroflexi bacterium]|nr:hypothetical protein [Chloroflexota bacterium]